MVSPTVLPFERRIADLLARIYEVRALVQSDARFACELERLERETARLAHEFFSKLDPMQRVQLSRHANRPYTLEYVRRLCTDWVELKGDRRFGDDLAIVGGLATYHGRSVVIVGHQKGGSTKENLQRNFGMPHPEGYRKAVRLFELGDRFGLPILTFIDTPGAYPGVDAEERGQAEAIASSIACMTRLRVPVIASIIGEGGSGGALALGVANRVLVLELGCYSVISPEGCAAILWKDGSRADEAARQLRLTSTDLLRFAVVDEVVPEPPGGAHHDHDEAARLLDEALLRSLEELERLPPAELRRHRYERFRNLGPYES